MYDYYFQLNDVETLQYLQNKIEDGQREWISTNDGRVKASSIDYTEILNADTWEVVH